MIKVNNMGFEIKNKTILNGLDFDLPKGRFLAVLGENGAGKTTFLDLLMGFKSPTSGGIKVFDSEYDDDSCELRKKISYMSEKIDIPGDWNGRDFLDFHSFFYDTYDFALEKELIDIFKIDETQRSGSMSAGEGRRLQIVGALATHPELIIIDEITAVLDILARIRFLKTLKRVQQEQETTIILATNIPEGLEHYASDILLLNRGNQLSFSSIDKFIDKKNDTLAEQVMEVLSSC